MIHLNALDFKACRSEEVISFVVLSLTVDLCTKLGWKALMTTLTKIHIFLWLLNQIECFSQKYRIHSYSFVILKHLDWFTISEAIEAERPIVMLFILFYSSSFFFGGGEIIDMSILVVNTDN